jgi:hypothetical protein
MSTWMSIIVDIDTHREEEAMYVYREEDIVIYVQHTFYEGLNM